MTQLVIASTAGGAGSISGQATRLCQLHRAVLCLVAQLHLTLPPQGL